MINYVIEKGKGLLIVINKWDLIEKDTYTMKNYHEDILYEYPNLKYYPIIFISVKHNLRVSKVLDKTLDIYESFEEIFDIRKANFLPKPKLKPLKTLIDKYNLNPENIVYFEDLEKNLLTAHKIGITTILISDSIEKTNYKPFINFRAILKQFSICNVH